MANGYKSLLAFWLGGACVVSGAVQPPATFVIGSMDVYPVLGASPGVRPLLDGSVAIDPAVEFGGEGEISGRLGGEVSLDPALSGRPRHNRGRR